MVRINLFLSVSVYRNGGSLSFSLLCYTRIYFHAIIHTHNDAIKIYVTLLYIPMPGLGLGLGLAEGLAMVAGLTDFIFTSTVVVFVLWWSVPCEPVLAGLPSPGLLVPPPPDDTCSLRSVRVKDRGS